MRSIGIPELLVLCGPLVLLGLALFLLVSRMRSTQSQSVQRALIEKLPANDLAAMLQSPQGEKLVQSISRVGDMPGALILSSVRRGIVVLVTGIGGLVVAVQVGYEQRVVIAAIAMMVIFIGAGLLIAGVVSYWLSRRWYLLQ